MTDLRVDVRFEPGDADALRRAEQRLGLAISAARLGAWEYEVESRVLRANAQCKANHGFGPDEDLQLERDIIPAIEPSHRQQFRDTIERAIATGSAFEIELPHRFPDGSHHWVLIAGQIVTPGTLLGVSKDITLRKQGEQALLASEEALREADRLKDEFLAVVAHELRARLPRF